jgi:hypothetical protein
MISQRLRHTSPYSMNLRTSLKRLFPGVAWKHPVLDLAVRAIDPFGRADRSCRGLGHPPPCSARARSNGVTDQLGQAAPALRRRVPSTLRMRRRLSSNATASCAGNTTSHSKAPSDGSGPLART